MVASEAAPFAKTGGLADVLGSLPAALVRLGDDVAVLLPLYRGIPLPPGGPILTLPVQVGPHGYSVAIHEIFRHNVRYLFADCPSLYDRAGLYGTASGDYPTITFGSPCYARPHWVWPARFSAPMFSRARLAGRPAAGLSARKPHARSHVFGVRCVLTIHNLGYQGSFPATAIADLGLDRRLFHPEGLEFFGRLNFLKAGIVWADAVNAVSPTYAREIQTPNSGSAWMGSCARARPS